MIVVVDININNKIKKIYNKYKLNSIMKNREKMIRHINEKIIQLQKSQVSNSKVLINILEYLKEREDKNV